MQANSAKRSVTSSTVRNEQKKGKKGATSVDSMTKADLLAFCRLHDLPTDGGREELIRRAKTHQESQLRRLLCQK